MSKVSNAKKIKERICRIFSDVQSGSYLPQQAVTALQLVQEECDKDKKSNASGMEPGLNHCLNLFLATGTSTAQERLLKTFVDFALVEAGPRPKKQCVCKWPNHTYATSVLRHVLNDATRSSDKNVRVRSCQIVAQLLRVSEYPEEYFANEDDILRLVLLKMQERLKDKCGSVRAQALYALSRLQRPEDGSEDIIHEQFLKLLETDPDSAVRLAAVNTIAITPQSIEELIKRTRDVSEEVRKASFNVLTKKIDVFSFTPDQRASLIEILSTKSPTCFEDCYKMVHDSWLVSTKGNIIRLLGLLDVERHEEVSEALIHVLLQRSPGCRMVCFTSQESEEEFSLSFTVTLCGPHKAIQAAATSSPRRSFVFRTLTPELSLFWRVYCEHFYEPLGDLLQDALPELTFVCQLAEQHLKDAFMCKQIMRLLQSVDLYDEVGRLQLHEFLLQNIYELASDKSFVDPFMHSLRRLYPLEEQWLKTVIRVLLIMKRPLGSDDDGDGEDGKELDISPEMQAKIWVKCLNVVCKTLEMTKRSVKDPLIGPMMQTFILPTVVHSDPAVRIEGVRALGLFCLLDRAVAREYLFLFLKVLENDTTEIRLVSLQALLDLILAHGTKALGIENSLESEENNNNNNSDNNVNNSVDDNDSDEEDDNSDNDSDDNERHVLKVIVECLNDSELRVLAAEGLAKCFYVGALRCPQVFGRLIVLRCDPTLAGDGRLQKCLESFFYAYVSSKPFHARHQAIAARSLVPALCWCDFCNKGRKRASEEILLQRIVETVVQLTEFVTQTNSSTHNHEIGISVVKDFVEYMIKSPSQTARCVDCLKYLKVPSTCRDPELLAGVIRTIEEYLSTTKEVGTPSRKFSKLLKSLKSVTTQIEKAPEESEDEALNVEESSASGEPKTGGNTDNNDDGDATDTELGGEDENEMVIMKQTLIERCRSYEPEDSEIPLIQSSKPKSRSKDINGDEIKVNEANEDTKCNPPEPKKHKVERIILFAGFTKFPELRSQLEKQVVELGGTVRGEDESVTSSITHVVRPEGALSTRMLVAALFGAWVVGPSWVSASSAQGAFVNEEEYGKRFTEENMPLVGKKVVMHESYKDDPKFDGIFDTLLIRDAGKAEIVEFAKGVKCDIALVAKNVSGEGLKELVETGARICTRTQFYKSLLP